MEPNKTLDLLCPDDVEIVSSIYSNKEQQFAVSSKVLSLFTIGIPRKNSGFKRLPKVGSYRCVGVDSRETEFPHRRSR